MINPDLPSCTTSLLPPAVVAMIGVPMLIASITARGNPSPLTDGCTNTSEALISEVTSLRYPVRWMRLLIVLFAINSL